MVTSFTLLLMTKKRYQLLSQKNLHQLLYKKNLHSSFVYLKRSLLSLKMSLLPPPQPSPTTSPLRSLLRPRLQRRAPCCPLAWARWATALLRAARRLDSRMSALDLPVQLAMRTLLPQPHALRLARLLPLLPQGHGPSGAYIGLDAPACPFPGRLQLPKWCSCLVQPLLLVWLHAAVRWPPEARRPWHPRRGL